ncbi:diguanylate cyclase [Paucilactobacillus suebicus]|uniref:Signal transduction diguanylate cyclase n=1 Tax=Paucilactobacillus suebicus DSM 5007 = KCTC 3549 TaxID=1423807 RepID=A0A0R1W2B4_9LACO|nr:diguanylate cyclase [Paucilactobacillus suebicus]KRM11992.1 Signal transduction diguanylate cyclase [Paucilactobacillus suebicus DSM 5007 = KCTC 3549]
MKMNMQLVSLGPWITQLIVATFFIAGFVSYYSSLWRKAFKDRTTAHNMQIFYRIALIVLGIGIGLILHITGYIANSNAMMYHNVGLFVLFFMLFDDQINNFEFAIRGLGVFVIWTMHHMGDLTQFTFWGSVIILVVMLLLIRRYHNKIRYNLLLNSITSAILSFDFWLTLPHISAGLTLNYGIAFEAILMFMVMSVFTSEYYIRQHKQELHNDEMEKLASYDTLTNAKSYSLYQQDSVAMFNNARDDDQPLTLVALDVDHFKLVNDRYGHLAGNRVLVGIATMLRDTLRQYGYSHQIYRTGGEEFNIAFPNQTPEKVMPIITQCWQSIRENVFDYNGQSIKATISVGMTSLRIGDKTVDETYKRADDNLYTSKRNGRDIITIDGKVQHVRDNDDQDKTYAYFSQGIYDISKPDQPLINNALSIRQYDHVREKWIKPQAPSLSITQRIDLLRDCLVNSHKLCATLYLSVPQFNDVRVAAQLIAFCNSVDGPESLAIALDSMPSIDSMKHMSEIYRAANIKIVIDKITVDTDRGRLIPAMHYINGIKFDLAENEDHSETELRRSISNWAKMALEQNVDFILSGVTNQQQVNWARKIGNIFYMQGDYFMKAELPIIA